MAFVRAVLDELDEAYTTCVANLNSADLLEEKLPQTLVMTSTPVCISGYCASCGRQLHIERNGSICSREEEGGMDGCITRTDHRFCPKLGGTFVQDSHVRN